jgi:hypothetical protein
MTYGFLGIVFDFGILETYLSLSVLGCRWSLVLGLRPGSYYLSMPELDSSGRAQKSADS